MSTANHGRWLFLDDHDIAEMRNVRRRRHQGKKSGAVLSPECPWEAQRVYCFGTVLGDADHGYRMWYISRLGPGNSGRCPGLADPGDMVCYATSEDGLVWDRPSLGLVPFDGSNQTNILFVNGHCPSVDYDPSAPAMERYRMAVHGWGEDRGYTLRYSADGLRWQYYRESPMFGETVRNEVMCIARDPRSSRFFAYHRRWADNYKPRRRVIAASWSDDFRHWSPARLIVVPDSRDVRAGFSERLGTEFYDMSGFWYESQFVGLLPVFIVQSYEPERRESGSNVSPWDGPIEAELVHSRDGMDWHRYDDRTPVLPRGEGDAFDAGCVLGLSSRPVVLDEEIRIYYTGVNTTHGGVMPPKTVSVGLARWRRDGFVSLSAGSERGRVETVTLDPSGSSLCVNADVGDGELAIELVNADGTVVPGYSSEDCVPIRADSTKHVVEWRGRNGVDAGKPVRVRFTMRNTELFSYWFE